MERLHRLYEQFMGTSTVVVGELMVRLQSNFKTTVALAMLVLVGCWIGHLAVRRQVVPAVSLFVVACAVPYFFVPKLLQGRATYLVLFFAMVVYVIARLGLQIKRLPATERGLRTFRDTLPLLRLVVVITAIAVGASLVGVMMRSNASVDSGELASLPFTLSYLVALPACVLLGSTLWNGSWWRQLLLAFVLLSGFFVLTVGLVRIDAVPNARLAVLDVGLLLLIPLLVLRWCGLRLVFERPIPRPLEPVRPKSPFDD